MFADDTKLFYLLLKLAILKIGNNQVQRKKAIKFLGAMLDENLDWQEHICTIEKKNGKNIGLIYRDKYLLNKSSPRCIYFVYIHSYLNYVNIVRGSTYQTKLKSVHLLQKRATRNIFNEGKMRHSRPLL